MIKTNNNSYRADNILNSEGLVQKIRELKGEGKSIGLCSGSFDLLHPGHITHLNSAKGFCDILIVAIATDEWSERVKSKKGRPIFSEQVRAYSVAQLKSVDFVVFNDDEFSTIALVNPDYYIKGSDYKDKQDPVVDSIKRVLESMGGKVVYTKDEKLSTTQVIDYIKKEINSQ